MQDHLQLEAPEAHALKSWHDAAKAQVPTLDWRLETIGDAICSVSSEEPGILVNRVLGLGSRGAPTVQQLESIRALYAGAGVERFFLHVVPAQMPANYADILAEAGYRNYRGWMKFTRGAGSVCAASTDLEVRAVGPEQGDDFAAIAAPAFDLKPSSQDMLAAIVGSQGHHAFMTFDDDRPAGTGIIFIDGNIGVLDWGATHPDYRRRGSQTAVLSARVEFALKSGCTTLCTMTGEAVPGDPQHSYSNIQRAGFNEAYLRENWIPGLAT